ncbi:MAG: DUF3611 family protein [Cyanobacteria bacterium P01_C01_bin.89]
MLSRPDPPSSPQGRKAGKPSLRRIANALQTAGWIGFWTQIALGLAAVLLLLISIPGIIFGENSSQGVSIAIFFAIVSVAIAGFSTSLCLRYTRISKGLLQKENARQPKKSDTVQLLRLGIYAGFAGIAIALIGSGISIGVLVAKSVSQPTGAMVSDTTKIVRPLDTFVVLACMSGLSANFVGMSASLWLFDRIVHPQS